MDTDLTDLLDLDGPQSIPGTVKENELASLLGITANRVRTLARDGVIIRAGRGRYDVRASLASYVGKLRTHAAQAGRPSEGGDALKEARTRLAEEQAALTAIKVAQANGELVSIADVKQEWATIAIDLRNALLAVPARLGLTIDQAEHADREMRLALETLTDAQ